MGTDGVDKPKRKWTMSPDWAMMMVGVGMLGSGVISVFGPGIGLMVAGAAIMVVAVIL